MGILKKIRLVLALLFIMVLIKPEHTNAQCSMCTATAESAVSGENKTGLGLNDGILMLLAMPYAVVMIIGVLWYRNSKFKKVKKLKQDLDY